MSFDFNQAFPSSFKPAGALPSSRTEGMTDEVVAPFRDSDDDAVLALAIEAMHLRGHYQSLEYAVAAVDINIEVIEKLVENATTKHGLDATDPKQLIEFIARFYAASVVTYAYDTTHMSMPLMSMGATAGEAIRAVYPNLDYSDPEREATSLVDLDDDQ